MDITGQRLNKEDPTSDPYFADEDKVLGPEEQDLDPELEGKIARDTLERYSGSDIGLYQPFLLLTNFPKYVDYFSESRNVAVHQGSMFQVAHSPEDKVSILDFKIGSPAAALAADLVSYLPIKSSLLLGMCGGLRAHHQVGDYLVPIASIRGEGTSDFYFPPEVPALANFLVQKQVSNVLEEQKIKYHIGITHTTNKRFWEFNKAFRERLRITRPQSIEMECATLFAATYKSKLPLGALLLISDLPLDPGGIKTKESSRSVYKAHTAEHVELGVEVMHKVEKALDLHEKGAFRGPRKRFADSELEHPENG